MTGVYYPDSMKTPNPPRKSLNYNVIFTIANAVAAIASACAAIYALTVASSQVRVAKEQIDATYLSNLYTKQIDGIGSFETAIDKFTLFLDRDALIDISIVPTLDLATQIQSVMISHRNEYLDVYIQVTDDGNVLKLILPKLLHKHLDYGPKTIRDFLLTVTEFEKTKVSNASVKSFSEGASRFRASSLKWHDQFFKCMHDMLDGGKPVTQDLAKKCNFDYDDVSKKEPS
jgi:hypothetical protein